MRTLNRTATRQKLPRLNFLGCRLLLARLILVVGALEGAGKQVRLPSKWCRPAMFACSEGSAPLSNSRRAADPTTTTASSDAPAAAGCSCWYSSASCCCCYCITTTPTSIRYYCNSCSGSRGRSTAATAIVSIAVAIALAESSSIAFTQ